MLTLIISGVLSNAQPSHEDHTHLSNMFSHDFVMRDKVFAAATGIAPFNSLSESQQ